jgi:hypothetical protein
MDARNRDRYGGRPGPPDGRVGPPPIGEGMPSPVPRAPSTAAATNDATMTIVFRAVSWKSLFPEANKETAYNVLNELRASPLFDPDPQATRFVGEISEEEAPGTFTFQIAAKLKRPLKF